jgi:meiotically up-regulated gene 157 (Mug157) protein
LASLQTFDLDQLNLLKNTHNGTFFMHESFWLNNSGNYSRPWFAWANSLFGELILHLAEVKPGLVF